MGKTSNLTGLAEQIKDRTEADRALIEDQTSKLLEQHAQSLRQLSSAALTSTRSVIESETAKLGKALSGLAATIDKQSTALANSTGSLKKQADAQGQKLEAEIEAQTKRLLWLMRWPLLGTLAVCLLTCAGTWGYWTLAKPYSLQQMNSGSYQVMNGDGWTMCSLGTAQQPINRPCRLVK